MKRFMKIYKKIIMIFVLCVTMGIVLFFTDRNVMTTYAYTEEEKAAAKAWLSQNGYPPTMDGAQQAYQDYLNGKFGPVGGSGTPEDSVPQTPDETNNETEETTPPVSQEGDSAAEAKTEEEEGSSEDNTNTEKKEGSSDSETNTEKKEGSSGSGTKTGKKEGSSGSGTNIDENKGSTGSKTKAGTQKDGTQKDGSGSRTRKEEKKSSSDSKTKAVSQKGKSDAEAKVGKSNLETNSAENKQIGNESTGTKSDALLASVDGKIENPEGSDIGMAAENLEGSDISIVAENPEYSSINSEIAAGDLHAVKHGETNVILIIVVIGVIVLIYFIRHFYIGNKREKCQRQ